MLNALGDRTFSTPAAPQVGVGAVLKQIVGNGKSRLGHAADSLPLSAVFVVIVGLAFLLIAAIALSAYDISNATVTLIAMFVAAAISNIAGFGFSALCGALLLQVMDSPIYAVHVMTVCSIAIQLLSVAAQWRSLRMFLIGGVPGVPAGLYLLLHLPSDLYREVIGAVLIVYGGYLLMRNPIRSLHTGSRADAGAGFLGGLTGGLVAFPGAFVAIWCDLKGWDKARQRGVYQPFILAMQPIMLISIYLMRPASVTAPPLDTSALAFVPAALLGAWFGLRVFNRLSDRQFAIVLNALIVASGIGLVL